MNISARYSDGSTSGVRHGGLAVAGNVLVFSDTRGEQRFELSALSIPSRLGNTPRQIECPDGGLLEVADNDALDAALAAAGVRSDGLLHMLESRWRRVLMLLAGAALVLWLVVAFGVPALVRNALPLVPAHVDAALGEQVLQSLSMPPFDLPESKLDDATRGRILLAWEQHLAPQAIRPVRIIFRDGGWIGANALALPGGNLVVTDQLIELAVHDEEVIAVLAHELGHEEKRHAMQSLLESLTVLAAMALITGDVGSVAATAPWALVNSRYSREKETEADALAHALLENAGIAPSRLGDMLQRLQATHAGDEEEGWSMLMASHPATRERVLASGGELKDAETLRRERDEADAALAAADAAAVESGADVTDVAETAEPSAPAVIEEALPAR